MVDALRDERDERIERPQQEITRPRDDLARTERHCGEVERQRRELQREPDRLQRQTEQLKKQKDAAAYSPRTCRASATCSEAMRPAQARSAEERYVTIG